MSISRREFLKATGLLATGALVGHIVAGSESAPAAEPTTTAAPTAIPPTEVAPAATPAVSEQLPTNHFEYPPIPQGVFDALGTIVTRDMSGDDLWWDDTNFREGLKEHTLGHLLSREGNMQSPVSAEVTSAYLDYDTLYNKRSADINLVFADGSILPLSIGVYASQAGFDASFNITSSTSETGYQLGYYREVFSEDDKAVHINGVTYKIKGVGAHLLSPIYGSAKDRYENAIHMDPEFFKEAGDDFVPITDPDEINKLLVTIDRYRELCRYVHSDIPVAEKVFIDKNMRPRE